MKTIDHIMIIILRLINPYLSFLCFGHQLIAKIAFDNFNEQVKTKIQNYHRSADLSVKDDFVSAACWMDEVRAEGFKSMDLWHQTKLVYEPFGGSDYNFDVDAPYSYSVVKNAINILKRPKLNTDFSEVFAVRLLTHIVGDIHQPFHNITLQSSKFKRGDNGGNDIKVKQNVDISKLKQKPRLEKIYKNPGSMVDLHKLWDAVFGYFPDGDPKKADVSNWAAKLQTQFPFEDLKSELNERSLDWVNDMLNLSGRVQEPFIKSNEKLPLIITEDQINKNIDDLFRQMTLAGQRIAFIINKYLKTDAKLDFKMKLKTIQERKFFEKDLGYVQDYDYTNNQNEIFENDSIELNNNIVQQDLDIESDSRKNIINIPKDNQENNKNQDQEYDRNEKFEPEINKELLKSIENRKIQLNKNKKQFENNNQEEWDGTWN